MKKYILFLAFLPFFVCCTDEDKTSYLQVSDIELTDLGQVSNEFKFNALDTNEMQKCTVRSIHIAKKDTIKNIEAYIQDGKLCVNIVSSPYNCSNDSCFSMHEISFYLKGVYKQEYIMDIGVNHIYEKEFNYKFY